MKLTLEIIERYRKRKAGYQTVFRGPHGSEVLADLAKFCCAFEPTIGANDRDMMLNEGKRIVYLRIMKHLNFTTEELAAHYEGYMQVQS